GIVGVVHAERPASQPGGARVPNADAILPDSPQRQLLARTRRRERRRDGAESRGRPVDGAIGVADANSDRLTSLQLAPVGIASVPGERGALVKRRPKALLEQPPGNENLQL